MSVSEARSQEASHASCWTPKLLSTPCKWAWDSILVTVGDERSRQKTVWTEHSHLSCPRWNATQRSPRPSRMHKENQLICTYLRQIAHVSRIHPSKTRLGQITATDVQTTKLYPAMLCYWGLQGFQYSAVANTKGFESRQVRTFCTFERWFLM